MKFIDILPIYYDSDIKEKIYYPNYGQVRDCRTMLYGCGTGEIMVCSTVEPNKVITRFRCFGDPVVYLACCWHPDQEPPTQQLLGQSVVLTKQHIGHKHRIRTIIYGSQCQLVCLTVSNYNTPFISFKMPLRQANLHIHIHQLCPFMSAIIHNNIPKILFPCYEDNNKVRLWMPNQVIHQSIISCMEYCQGINLCSGDQTGKIVIWNLKEEVLVVAKISELIRVDIVYCWQNVLCFGYNGKIFQLDVSAYMEIKANSNIQQLLKNKEFHKQLTIQLSPKTSSSTLSSIFPSVPHHNIPPMQTPSRQLSSSQPFPTHLQILSKQKSQQIDRYVHKMKKQLFKLEREAESLVVQNFGHPKNEEKSKEEVYKSKSKNNNKIKSSRSHSLHKPCGNTTEVQLLQDSRIARAKSILQKFKNPVQREVSLPQIQNIRKNGELSMTMMRNQHILPEYLNEHADGDMREKKKKNRNKKYQFLFHFPNTGFYTQLISKNMIQ